MNCVPQWIKNYWLDHPARRCERWRDGCCSGRLTKEHVWLYAGKQIQELWAIIDLCWYHHLGDGLDKLFNEWISINRMTKIDEAKYPRKNWSQLRIYLNNKYRKYAKRSL